MKLQEINPNSTIGIKFRETLYATIAVADVQTTLLTDLMETCEDLNIEHLKRVLEVNQMILVSFSKSLGVDYAIRHGQNFDILHKEVMKFSKKSMK